MHRFQLFLTGFVILFISTLKSLFENNKHHYPDISGVLDRLFESYLHMKHKSVNQ